MSSTVSDVERALANIRSRSDTLRQTISRLGQHLAYNANVTWPELLGQYMVISKQMENLNDEIPEMIQHFVSLPKMSTANPADIPLLLRTKEDPEMEVIDADLLEKFGDVNIPWDVCRQKIERYNEFCESIEDTYKDMSDNHFKKLKADKFSTESTQKVAQSTMFQYIQTGLP